MGTEEAGTMGDAEEVDIVEELVTKAGVEQADIERGAGSV